MSGPWHDTVNQDTTPRTRGSVGAPPLERRGRAIAMGVCIMRVRDVPALVSQSRSSGWSCDVPFI